MSRGASHEFVADAILFDLDGVLANSNATVERAWSAWSADHQLDPREVLAYAHGRRTLETLAHFLPDLDAQPEIARLHAHEGALVGDVVAVDGAPAFIASLGEARWAVATSGTWPIATSRLAQIGIPQPRVLITAERVRRGKPDPEVYRLAADELGVDPRACIVFEDALAGVESGLRAGATVVALTTTFPADAFEGVAAVITDFRSARARTSGERIVIDLDCLTR